MAIYLKLGDIKGNVTDENHQGWIKLNSFDSKVLRQIPMVVGQTKDREHGYPKVNEIIITKEIDESIIGLLTQACVGKACGDAEIHFVLGNNTYLKFKLNNVIISKHEIISIHADQKPLERIALSFTQFESTFIPYSADNQQGSPLSMSYDLTTASVT